MKLSRRKFLKLTVPTAGMLALGGIIIPEQGSAKASEALSANGSGKMVIYDTSKCVGCHACEAACRRWNQVPPPESKPNDLSARTLTLVKSRRIESNGAYRWVHSKWQCMHCISPTCVAVCPANALYKTELGPVLYKEENCIGCRECVGACPFSVPRFDWSSNRVITKCTFCTDRISNSLEPACVEVCPQQALTFGERREIIPMVEEAEAGGAFVYGMNEAGGTSWIFISDVPFEERNFPAVGTETYISHSKTLWGNQFITVAASAATLGLYTMYLKRNKAEEEK